MIRWLFLLFLPCAALEITGEALYWRFASSGFDYAALELPGQAREVFSLEPNYDWGFAALGQADCLQVGGRYITGSVQAQIPGSVIFLPPAAGQLVEATLSTHYWMVEARALLPLYSSLAGTLEGMAGVRYANLQRRATISDSLNLSLQRSRFRGAGPELGWLAWFHLWRNVTVTGSLLFEALIGERSVAPGLESRLAIRLSRASCYFHWCAELGYQQDRYWNALSFMRGGSINTRNRTRSPFGFAGPYASFTLGY